MVSGLLLVLILVGVVNTVFNALARQFVLASVNGAACLAALGCMYLIYVHEV